MRKRLLLLYPVAWRERYGSELEALLDDTSPTVSGTLDLLRGALMAHLRPPVTSTPATRARGAVAGVLGCFIMFTAFGLGFAKTTENDDHSLHVHTLLGITHSLILVTAIIAAGALVLAAVPLARASLAQAYRTRDPHLITLIAVPPAAIGVFAGSVALLVLWLNAHQHRADAGAWLLLGLCGLCGAAGGFACWAAPRAIMRRIDIPRGAFIVSVPALAFVAVCMTLITIATGAFLVGIVVDAPGLAAVGNGPGQVLDVTASIAIQFVAMLSLSAMAGLSAARGLRSL